MSILSVLIWLTLSAIFVMLIATYPEMKADMGGWLFVSIYAGLCWPLLVLHGLCGGIWWVIGRCGRSRTKACLNERCGARVRQNASYCGRCGGKLI